MRIAFVHRSSPCESYRTRVKIINYQFGRGSTVFLCASDYESAEQYGFESSEYKEGTNRLIEFYKKLGFSIVKDNIMVYTEKDI